MQGHRRWSHERLRSLLSAQRSQRVERTQSKTWAKTHSTGSKICSRLWIHISTLPPTRTNDNLNFAFTAPPGNTRKCTTMQHKYLKANTNSNFEVALCEIRPLSEQQRPGIKAAISRRSPGPNLTEPAANTRSYEKPETHSTKYPDRLCLFCSTLPRSCVENVELSESKPLM